MKPQLKAYRITEFQPNMRHISSMYVISTWSSLVVFFPNPV